MTGERLTIGGVQFDKNQVTSYRKKVDSEGKTIHMVKAGYIEFRYPTQKGAKVESYGPNAVGVYNLNDAMIYGTDNKFDQIALFNSKNNVIDVNDTSDIGTKEGTTPADHVQLPKGDNTNIVYKNKQDTVIESEY